MFEYWYQLINHLEDSIFFEIPQIYTYTYLWEQLQNYRGLAVFG